jgi:hypothetical protein
MNLYRKTTLIGVAVWLYVAARFLTFLHSQPLTGEVVVSTFFGGAVLVIAAFLLAVAWTDNSNA